jgi:hypothetical protein
MAVGIPRRVEVSSYNEKFMRLGIMISIVYGSLEAGLGSDHVVLDTKS